MARERFLEHFCSNGSWLIIRPEHGQPYRLDGKPLTAVGRQILDGKDPVAEQLTGLDSEDPEEE